MNRRTTKGNNNKNVKSPKVFFTISLKSMETSLSSIR